MSARRRGSCRFDDYYKAQWYDTTSLTWRDVQRAFPTEDACRAAFTAAHDTWRVMRISEKGRTIVG